MKVPFYVILVISLMVITCQTMETQNQDLDITQITIPADPFYFHAAHKEKTWLITPTAPGPLRIEVMSQDAESLEVTLNGETSEDPLAHHEGQNKIVLEYNLDQVTLDQEKRFYITVRWIPQVRSISLEQDVEGTISISYPEFKIEN